MVRIDALRVAFGVQRCNERIEAMLNKDGHEICDQTPMSLPAGFKRPETLAEQVQRLVRTTVSREATAAGAETFEESEDYEVGDELEPSTPYEAHFDPVLGRDITAEEFRLHQDEYKRRYIIAQSEYYASMDAEERLARGIPPQPATPAEPLKATPPAATNADETSLQKKSE